MAAIGAAEPIIVGGAAVEIYTLSAIHSGDVDIAVPDQRLLEDELLNLGFVRDTRSGSHRGLYHPAYRYGLEVVARTPMEGRPRRDFVTKYRTRSGYVFLISIEDLIADRVAQYDAPPRGDQPRLRQAIALYVAAPRIDRQYLGRRIAEEAPRRTLAWFLKEVAKATRRAQGSKAKERGT